MKRAVRLLLLIALRVLAVGVVMLWATARLGTLSVAVPVGSRAFGFATTTNGLIVGTEPADGATQSSWRFRSYLAAVDETRVTMQSVLGNGGNVVEGHVWCLRRQSLSFLGMSYPVCLALVGFSYLITAWVFRKRRQNLRGSLLDAG